MELIPTCIPDVKLFTPARFKDHRGFFSEVYSDRAFREIAGREVVFVQDNHSLSVEKGVLRGLHYQMAPMDQEKLLRVFRGAILDIDLDIRRNSPPSASMSARSSPPTTGSRSSSPRASLTALSRSNRTPKFFTR